MSLPDVNSNCLNRGQKYKTYLSHAFSRKNLPYWLMHVSQNPNFCHIGKYGSFSKLSFPPDRSIWGQNGNPISLESASGFLTKPSYYNLKISILKYSPISLRKCPQNESLRKCPKKSRQIFKTDIFNYNMIGLSGTPTRTPD